MLVPVAILILAGTGFVSQAFAAFTITMETDKDIYDHSSVITVTGHVDPVDPTGSEVTIIVKSTNPPGIVQIDQIDVNSNGDFSTTIETANVIMKKDGTYLIYAKYVDVDTTVSVELTNAIEASEPEADVTGTAGTAVTGTDVTGPSGEPFYKLGPGQIEYDMTCNADPPAFFANADDDSIVIYLDPADDGMLTITLHEELIKPFEDGTFVVIIDNQEMQDFTQDGNTLTIPCVAGTEKIEIHGSWAIPEFGVIAAMILAVAIISIIVVTAKTKLSIVPRY